MLVSHCLVGVKTPLEIQEMENHDARHAGFYSVHLFRFPQAQRIDCVTQSCHFQAVALSR